MNCEFCLCLDLGAVDSVAAISVPPAAAASLKPVDDEEFDMFAQSRQSYEESQKALQ